MRDATSRTRQLLVSVGLLSLLATPLTAQGNSGTATTSTTATTVSSGTDTLVREPKEDRGFPWGLLGLLGLGGLLKRPQRETVVQREVPLRDTTTGPGGPNYRV